MPRSNRKPGSEGIASVPVPIKSCTVSPHHITTSMSRDVHGLAFLSLPKDDVNATAICMRIAIHEPKHSPFLSPPKGDGQRHGWAGGRTTRCPAAYETSLTSRTLSKMAIRDVFAGPLSASQLSACIMISLSMSKAFWYLRSRSPKSIALFQAAQLI